MDSILIDGNPVECESLRQPGFKNPMESPEMIVAHTDNTKHKMKCLDQLLGNKNESKSIK